MLRALPVLIQLGLLVFCLVDCIQTDSVLVRNLSKTAWILLIVFLPLVGGVAWLVAGRPARGAQAPRVAWPSTATAGFPEYERPRAAGPDDDPAFLAGLRASDDQHERMLRDWEADLRARERELRSDPPADGTDQPRA
ncbi:PLD nuclease N-terminal domain-containing protein [Cellulomonas endometrii]|uniref:PLD nuclease N-terminal domain-containing protein n=1 Tax=Cellulomonas endometrii TaxID=3036301 RepID=UPI0024ADAAFA|nr:PLD nuclease N-terminal domain-containing protein [Cellulomonas endometrii]